MNLEKVISMANKNVQLRFLAMERSLRATGCELPLWVIPYNENLFDLPEGSTWWEIPEITNWLTTQKTHPAMRKYQCLTVKNYQFVDADVCFLRNPEEVLQPYSGFITSCGHWRDPNHTCTPTSYSFLSRKSTLWQLDVFNSGQFASDCILYTANSLQKTIMEPNFIETCLQCSHNEQPGLNLLVLSSGVQITNLTLPPLRMESTWAGDYPEDYEHYWQIPERKPYLIHWAGIPMHIPRPINSIFYSFLTQAEQTEWDEQVRAKKQQQKEIFLSVKSFGRRLKQAWKPLINI